MANLTDLPDAIWVKILSHLSPADTARLLLVNRSIQQTIQPYIYHELTLTEWASSGARLARAILDGVVSDSTAECIKKMRIEFTSMDEINETLQLSISICRRMRGLLQIDVDAHFTGDALLVVAQLASVYSQVQSWGVSARAAADWPLALCPSVLPLITNVHLPRLFRQELGYLNNVQTLYLDEVIEDGSSEVLRTAALVKLVVPLSVYAQIGRPPALHLELYMGPGDQELVVDDALCCTLKLVATHDLPQIEPALRVPSLRALVLCNVAPEPTFKLVERTDFSTVEFISLAPVTTIALQALYSKKQMPSLRIVVLVVLAASFVSDLPTPRKREVRRHVEWLQMLASKYPVDVRDPQRLLDMDIYFSDGLWCLASQTPFSRLLQLVPPPPLR